MPAPKSDPQRDNVYWLEAEINGNWNIDRAPREALLFAIKRLARYYHLPEPKLVLSGTMGEDAGWYGNNTIYLNRTKGANVHTLIHEFSHHVIETYYEEFEPHGREFVGVYMHLLDKYSILPHECFRLLAKKHRIKIGRRFRPRAFK